MSNYSAQGSITVRRLRNGDSIFLSLELNGKPLYQAVDEQTGVVVPDWSIEANRPIITPRCSTVRGQSIYLSNHGWSYNGVALVFDGETVGSYVMDSTEKFGLDTSNGALKIFANLASAINMANDTLLYSCQATVGGVEYNLSKSIDVQIAKGAGSSYFGFINASTTQLDIDHDTATLVTELWLATSQVTDYYVKWYKDTVEWVDKAGQKQITVTKDDIDGCQLFIAEFYKASGDTEYIYRYGISIIDTMDEIILVPYIQSANKEVSENMPVTVKARVIRTSTGAVLSPVNPSWEFTIYDGDTWQVKGSSNTDSIQVTTTHTDQQDGSTHDVEVIAEVSFDSLSS